MWGGGNGGDGGRGNLHLPVEVASRKRATERTEMREGDIFLLVRADIPWICNQSGGCGGG